MRSACSRRYVARSITLAIPGTLLAKAILPSTSISIGALIWSIATACMTFATTFGGVIACRLAVGAGEALFGQAVALYYSYWYSKEEIATRLSIFIGAGALSGALGGFIVRNVPVRATRQSRQSTGLWRQLDTKPASRLLAPPLRPRSPPVSRPRHRRLPRPPNAPGTEPLPR